MLMELLSLCELLTSTVLQTGQSPAQEPVALRSKESEEDLSIGSLLRGKVGPTEFVKGSM